MLDRRAFQRYRTALVLLAAIRELWPERFAWREPPYEYEFERMPIDLISGSDELRSGLAAGNTVRDLSARAPRQVAAFERWSREFQLYE